MNLCDVVRIGDFVGTVTDIKIKGDVYITATNCNKSITAKKSEFVLLEKFNKKNCFGCSYCYVSEKGFKQAFICSHYNTSIKGNEAINCLHYNSWAFALSKI